MTDEVGRGEEEERKTREGGRSGEGRADGLTDKEDGSEGKNEGRTDEGLSVL